MTGRVGRVVAMFLLELGRKAPLKHRLHFIKPMHLQKRQGGAAGIKHVHATGGAFDKHRFPAQVNPSRGTGANERKQRTAW